MAPTAILLALTAASPDSGARPPRSELHVSAGMVVPSPSDYRYSAEFLGYGSRGMRPDFGGEVGYVRGLSSWLGLGPMLRVHAGQMSAPYGGLEPLQTWGAALGVRAEADVFRYPRLFFWLEPALGTGLIGVPDARKSVSFYDVRGGVGLGTLRDDRLSLRLRVGWSYAPTFDVVTPLAGKFNYGGLVFQLDGVFRVSR